jgi:hypothetical protein
MYKLTDHDVTNVEMSLDALLLGGSGRVWFSFLPPLEEEGMRSVVPMVVTMMDNGFILFLAKVNSKTEFPPIGDFVWIKNPHTNMYEQSLVVGSSAVSTENRSIQIRGVKERRMLFVKIQKLYSEDFLALHGMRCSP